LSALLILQEIMERIRFREGRVEAPLPGWRRRTAHRTKLAVDAGAEIYAPPAPELTGSGGFIDGLR